jgi:exodeoxyribonuclease VII small subunit
MAEEYADEPLARRVDPAGTDGDTDTATDRATGEQPPSYEQARDELVAIVARLESGEASLEESITLWERGETLATICQDWLDGARRKLAEATPTADHEEAPSGPDSPT